MRWEPDVSRGAWLRTRLEAEDTRPWTMHLMVPRGFDRYARIFHRVRPMGSPRDAPPSPWHEVAAAHGATAHPLMRWADVNRIHQGEMHVDPLPIADDLDGPEFGRLEEDQLSAIAEHLARHTSTPDVGVAAVWDGYGDLFAHSYGRSWITVGGPDPDPVPGLPDEVFHGPRLPLPWRGHVLFDAGVREFGPGWASRAPWVHDSHPRSPSILWPEDRAWVLVCDTDWTSTIIGGPVELMAPLLSDPAVDGAIIPPESSLAGFG